MAIRTSAIYSGISITHIIAFFSRICPKAIVDNIVEYMSSTTATAGYHQYSPIGTIFSPSWRKIQHRCRTTTTSKNINVTALLIIILCSRSDKRSKNASRLQIIRIRADGEFGNHCCRGTSFCYLG